MWQTQDNVGSVLLALHSGSPLRLPSRLILDVGVAALTPDSEGGGTPHTHTHRHTQRSWGLSFKPDLDSETAHCLALSISSLTASPEHISDQFRKRTPKEYFRCASFIHSFMCVCYAINISR